MTERRRAEATLWLCLIVALFVQAYAGLGLRGLYADGAFFATHLAAARDFVIIQTGRPFAEMLTQWPVLVAMRLGATAPHAVALAFSLASNLVPGLLILACLAALAPGDRALFVLPAFVYLGGILSAQFASVGEGLAATAYLWLLLTAAVSGPLTLGRGLLLAVLALGCSDLHEEMLFLCPVLLAGCTLRARRERQLAAWLPLGAVALCAVAGTVVGITLALHPVDPGERSDFIQSFLNLEWLYTPWAGVNLGSVLTCTATLFLLIALLCPSWGRPLQRIFLPLSLGTGLAAFAFPALVAPAAQFAARNNAALLSLPLGILFLVAKARPQVRSALTAPAVLGLVASLGLGVSLWHLAATRDWIVYRDVVAQVLENARGIVPSTAVTQDKSAREQRLLESMSWPWTNPDLSIVLLPRRLITSILANPAHHAGWEPYDLKNPASLPAIPGITYRYLLP
ncbi:hypothetical protein [Acidisoma sp. 7E03]